VSRSELPARADVVVVGAGLAGLAAARHLLRHSVDTVVLEARDAVGGRVATAETDGFLLDRGFQVFNTSYPEARAVLDLERLDLHPFLPGALIRRGDRLHRLADPRRLPSALWSDIAAPVATPRDRMRLLALTARLMRSDGPRLTSGADVTTLEALRAAGLSEVIVERFLRPFLSGVFLEEDMQTAARFFAVVWRSFARGTATVPARGMHAIPRQLAGHLPANTVHTGVSVSRVTGSRVACEAGEVRARAVVVATDPETAGSLLPGLARTPMRGVTTYYHVPDEPPTPEALIVLDGEQRRRIANSVVLTNAAPSYSLSGRPLVSTSVLGTSPPPEPAVRAELARLYGCDTRSWDPLAVVAVPQALPALVPPAGSLRRPVRLTDGLYVAGDHRDTPSIQGALVSGRRAAHAVLHDLGVT
jgi:phytoene dehydrogenase-like protein